MPAAPGTETIYVRVPGDLKTGAKDYAEANGMTLTAAIADLLDRGLEAVENEESIASLQEQIAARDGLLAEAETRAQGLQALANQPLGICAQCKSVITAVDVLVKRKCPKGHELRPPAEADKAVNASGLDDNQSLILIGAVGLLLGAAYLAANSG